MKRRIQIPNKLKAICVGTICSGILLSTTSFATTIDDLDVKYSTEYKKWLELSQEEKIQTPMPNTYNADLTDELIANFTKINTPSILNEFTNRKDNFSLENMSAVYTDSTYNLNNDTKVAVKNQMSTNECWAFSAISSLETNLSLTKQLQEITNFSVRHMDYATSRTFLDGVNEQGYKREVGEGGIPNVAFNYLINGQGAVLESDMPFKDNEDKVNLSEIDKQVNTIATGYNTLPSIYKKYDSEGNAICYNSNGVEYSEKALEAARNIIKSHLINYGAIAATTAANHSEYYNNPSDIVHATAYYCNNSNLSRDHAITIVGWDDNYSRTNFNKDNMPKKDGAYIVLNSYSTDVMDKGYYYISYEDYLIEASLYGVTSTSKVDYDNIYQNDFYGGIYPVGASSQDTGYIASIFTRKETVPEVVNSIGISAMSVAEYEIYINPVDSDISLDKLVKVGETGYISQGYQRVDITPTKVTGEKFAVVVKQKSYQGTGFYFPIETKIKDTVYEYATSNSGNSLISLDGDLWYNLKDINIQGVDMENADTCLKAFTTISKSDNSNDNNTKDDENKDNNDNKNDDNNGNNNNNNNDNNKDDNNPSTELKIISEYYKIQDGYITKVTYNTKISAFKKNITTNATQVDFIDANGNVITNTEELVKTGMKVKFNNTTEYTIIVRGDLNGDGNISLVDFSKLIAHISERPEFILSGNTAMAADLSGDGKISLLDLSQFLVIFSAI